MMSHTHGKHGVFITWGLLVGTAIVSGVLACTPAPSGMHRANAVIHSNGDVLASGPRPEIADSVAWDALMAGGTLRFSGATGGDYLGAGGSQRIGGRIHGAVRAAGGEVRLAASVDRDATVAGRNVVVEPTAVVAQNAYLAGGTVQMDGTVRHALRVAGGTVLIDGAVEGNVEINARTLRVGPHAVIGGNLRYRVPPRAVHIDPAARVTGTITALPTRERRWGALELFRALWLLGFLIAGGVAVALVPQGAAGAEAIMRRRPGASALVGIAWLILVPIACAIAMVTVVGAPLALVAFGLYLILAYLGRVVPAIWVGRRLLGHRAGTGRDGVVRSLLAGALLLVLVECIPVIGSLVAAVATLVGVGALVLGARAWRLDCESARRSAPETIVV